MLPATGVFWPWHLHWLSDSTLDTCTCTCTGAAARFLFGWTALYGPGLYSYNIWNNYEDLHILLTTKTCGKYKINGCIFIIFGGKPLSAVNNLCRANLGSSFIF